MKRLITAISLLTIAGILCGIGFLGMKKQVNTLTQLFHEGAQAAQAEDEERLHTCTKELQKAWEKSHVVFFYADPASRSRRFGGGHSGLEQPSERKGV